MSKRLDFFRLLGASLCGTATTAELQQLDELLASNGELKYCTETLQALWEQEPEADQPALSAAWKKLKEVKF